ncbi:MAG: FG-GAP repeat protein [Myxococcota bacterium]
MDSVGTNREDGEAFDINGEESNGAESSGAVYLFRREEPTWHQLAYIKASNTNAEDDFGWSIDLDGGTLAISAPGESSSSTSIDGDQQDNEAEYSGAVYVRRVGE